MGDNRLWRFEVGSADVDAVQQVLDEAVAKALNGELSSAGIDHTAVDLPRVIDLDRVTLVSVDLRRLMTAQVSARGEPEAAELLIGVDPGLTVEVAKAIWTTIALPVLRRRFGADAVGRRTDQQVPGDQPATGR